jgi:NAD(P)-dependent dehydrogenase (short-subunit alcohol dehydrogenase family)
MQAAIVTGISRGLGAALVETLVARGYRVIGIGRGAHAGPCPALHRYVACDLGEPAGIAAAVDPALRELAALRPAAVTLVNNAAVAWPVGLVGRLDDSRAEAAIATNVVAPLVVCNAFLRAFPDDGIARRIINISSGAAQSAIAGSAVYSMSKAAVEMLTRAIVAEHTTPSFRCISLRPGIFDTDMQAFMRSHDPKDFPSVGMFHGFKDNALLKAPAEVAARIVARLVQADVEHGRTYTYQDL